jgi:hypothetical protein
MLLVRGCFLSAVLASTVGAQSVAAVRNAAARLTSTGGSERQTAGVISPSNPWSISAEVNIKSLAGDGKFSEQWLLTASKLTYEIPLDAENFHLAVLGNLAAVQSALGNGSKKDSVTAAIQSLTSSTDGLNVALFPYYDFPALPSFQTSIFGFAAAKINSFRDTLGKNDETLLTGRFGAGIEFRIGKMTSEAKPLTLSLAAVNSRFGQEAYNAIFKERQSQINSIEGTALLPLSTSSGVLFELVGMDRARPSFRLGMIIGAAKKPEKPSDITAGRGDTCPEGKCTIEITPVRGDIAATVSVTGEVDSRKGDPCTFPTVSVCNVVVKKAGSVTLVVPAGFVLKDDTGRTGPSLPFAAMTKNVKVSVATP